MKNEKLIHIHYAFLTLDATTKRIDYDMDEREDTHTVTTEINGTRLRWTDDKHCVAELFSKTFAGTLDDCHRYLGSFQYTKTDLNEIYYNETTKHEVA